jgi:hypothetical protein
MWCFTYLGLESTCSLRDIKKAFRKKAFLVHPDKFKDPNQKKIANIAFRELYAAYTESCEFNSKYINFPISSPKSSKPTTETSEPPKPPEPPKPTGQPTTESSKSPEPTEPPDIAEIHLAFDKICKELDRENEKKYEQDEKVMIEKLENAIPDFNKCWELLELVLHSKCKQYIMKMTIGQPDKLKLIEFIQEKRKQAADLHFEKYNEKWKQYATRIINVNPENKEAFDELEQWIIKTFNIIDYTYVINYILTATTNIPESNIVSPEYIKNVKEIHEKRTQLNLYLAQIVRNIYKKHLAMNRENHKKRLKKKADQIVKVFPDLQQIRALLFYHCKEDKSIIKTMLPQKILKALLNII